MLNFTGSHAQVRGACAHQGDGKNAPPNTIPAIKSAVLKGAHQIEFDVKLSRDKKLVIMHDWTVDSTTNGTGYVADLTFDGLRALDAGGRFSSEFKGTEESIRPLIDTGVEYILTDNLDLCLEILAESGVQPILEFTDSDGRGS